MLAIFCAARDFLVKNIITVVAGNAAGAQARIGGFSLSLMKQSVRITNFKMYSPKGFPRDVMIDIPLMRVSCDIFSILRGKIHLKELTLDLKEIELVKNKEGKLNVDELKIAESKDKGKKSAKEMPIQIDLLQIYIGKVVNKDYSVSGPAAIKVYEVGIKKTYKNITGAQQLAALIISEPLKAAGIQGLTVYSASMLTGIAAFPMAAFFNFAGKDYAQAEYNVAWDKAYAVGLSALKEAGKIKKEDRAAGVISAEVRGVQVVLKLKTVSERNTRITVSARKFMLSQPEVAAGVIYRISDVLQ